VKEPAIPKDLRSFLDEVLHQRPGDLKVVDREVDPRFGITAWPAAFERHNQSPAFLFTNVKGADTSCVTNVAATFERVAIALGTTPEELRSSPTLGPGHPAQAPVRVGDDEAPVREIVWEGDDARLDRLPIPTHNAADGGPYLTAAVGIMRDPDSGALNAGIYRHQVFDAKTMGVWYFGSHHGGTIFHRYEEAGQDAPIALAIGHHPAFLIGAVSRVPGIGGEFEVASTFLGEPVEIVGCPGSDLEVPARAEIVIEGRVLAGIRREEGPFAEWPGLYTAGGPKPVIEVDRITMRHDAIFQDIHAAATEHRLIGALPRIASVYKNVSNVVSDLRGVNIPLHTRMHCYLSIRKRDDSEPIRAAFAALNTEPENFRMVVVVDDDIDVHDERAVSWAIGTRFDAERDLRVIPRWNGPGGLLPTNWIYDAEGGRSPHMSSAVIVDATKPAPPVGYPEPAYVPDEAIDAIDEDDAKDVAGSLEPPRVRALP